MAINFTSINGGTGGGTTSVTDGDSTTVPGANNLCLVVVYQLMFTATVPNQPTVTGKGLTWVAQESVQYTFSGVEARLTVFRGLGASPTAAAVVIDNGAQSVDFWAHEIVQTPDVDTSGTNGSGAVIQSVPNTGNSSSASATLAAFGDSTNNATFYAVSHGQAGQAINPEAGMTAFTQRDVMRAAWRLGEDTSPTADMPTGPFDWAVIALEVKAAGGATPSRTQEGFRFRNDDGSETTATWKAGQDTHVTSPLTTTNRLRVLIDAAGDVASAQYRLDYKKSTDSVYVAVPVSQPTLTRTELTASSSTSNVATFTTASVTLTAGRLYLMAIVHSDTAPEGEASSIITTGGAISFALLDSQVFDTIASNVHRLSLWWVIPASTVTATIVITLPDAGTGCAWNLQEYQNPHPTTPLGTPVKNALNASTTITATPGALTNTRSHQIAFGANDLNATTDTASGTNWSSVGTGVTYATPNTALECANNTSGTASQITFSGAGSADRAVIAVEVRAANTPICMSLSANIAASGAATTAQLTAPSGKTTSDFVAGRIQDDENPADAVDITTDDYTEIEWSLTALTGVAANGDIYQFRVTVGGTPLDTYAVTPEWTIGVAGVDGAVSYSGVGTTSLAGQLVAQGSIAFAGVGTAAFAAESVGAVFRRPALQIVSHDASAARRRRNRSQDGLAVISTVRGLSASLDGAVSFSGVGTSAFAGQAVTSTLVAYAGAGTVAFAGERVALGAVAFAGAGTFSASGALLADAAVSFSGVGTASFAAEEESIKNAAVSFSGAGASAFSGERLQQGSVSYAGAATALFSGQQVAQGAVAYEGVASTLFAGSLITSGAVSYSGIGLVVFTAEPTAFILGQLLARLHMQPVLVGDVSLSPMLDAELRIQPRLVLAGVAPTQGFAVPDFDPRAILAEGFTEFTLSAVPGEYAPEMLVLASPLGTAWARGRFTREAALPAGASCEEWVLKAGGDRNNDAHYFPVFTLMTANFVSVAIGPRTVVQVRVKSGGTAGVVRVHATAMQFEPIIDEQTVTYTLSGVPGQYAPEHMTFRSVGDVVMGHLAVILESALPTGTVLDTWVLKHNGDPENDADYLPSGVNYLVGTGLGGNPFMPARVVRLRAKSGATPGTVTTHGLCTSRTGWA